MSVLEMLMLVLAVAPNGRNIQLKKALAKAYEGVRRVDYDKLEVIADSKDEVQIAFCDYNERQKDGSTIY